MQSNAEEPVENCDNIRDGIPTVPDQSWKHRVKKRLALTGISRERPPAIVAPPSKTNKPTQTTTPNPALQQPVVRVTATTAINHSVAPRRSAVEASRASDSAPVQGSSNTTDAHAAGGPSLAPGAKSPTAKNTATPDAEGTSAAPLGKNTQIFAPSSEVASNRQSITMADYVTRGLRRTSGTAVDAIVPVTPSKNMIEQDSENLEHRSEQEQNVLTEPASREYDQGKKEQFAKRNVHQILEHHLREYERVRIAICVDMEDYRGSRRVCVTCYDGAVDKARDIEKVLSKNGKSLHGFLYVVHRREGTKIFGYRGSDIDRIGAAAITSENSGDDSVKHPRTVEATTTHGDDIGGTSNERGGTHTYNGNYYNTYHVAANMTHMGGGSHTYNGTYLNGHHRGCSDGGDQTFSNTPYWARGSTMVEIFCGDERDGNITGAPIRMATRRGDGTSAVSLWTCGGIIKVGGVDYGLTTAHPFVLSNSLPSQEMPPSEDVDMTEDRSAENGPFGGNDDFFSAEEHPEKYWQAIGKVSHYALAKVGSIPDNNDWLLFTLPKDRSMWNDYNDNENWKDFGNSAELSIHDLAVFTARGALPAHALEGTAFLVLGNSPFEVLKIGLQEPLRPGDSGSWLMRGSKLVGVMIAGSEENPERPIGYAISAHELFRSISTSMGGLSVRPLTALENAINAKSQTGSQRDLVFLRIRQLFGGDAPVRRIEILHDHHTLSSLASIQTGNAALTALLKLGFFCSSVRLGFPIIRRPHLTLTSLWTRTERIGEILHQHMSQFSEGLTITRLILALLASLPLPKTYARASECASALSALMEELRISPVPAQTHLRALVVSVCSRHKLPTRLDVHYGGPKEATSPINLAGSLARALYAIQTDNFYVHKGVTAKYLKKFIVAYARYPVIAVDEKDDAGLLEDSLMISGVVPRIFVANLDSPHIAWGVKSKDSIYGRVVELNELNEALENSTTYWKAKERTAMREEEEPGKTPKRFIASTMLHEDFDKGIVV